ncbi:SDR family oxidoreductase [bacterium]|nr:SDR family oxidoreductase [candidate division CSSED10-310 bacterium]
MKQLNNRNVVITGGARGIGFAVAEACLRAGAGVVLVDLKAEDLTIAADRLQGGDAVHCHACNVADEEQVKALAQALKATPGSLDALVNNAGITRDNLFMRMTTDQWQSVIDVNLTGSFLMARHLVGLIRKSEWGRIVNLSSVAARGNAGQANYAASKAGVIGLTKTLALELARYQVTVNAVAPGFIETEMTQAIPEAARDEWLRKIPAARPGKPSDVADAVVFLLSDDAAYITGTVIGVDGGLGI